jgi:hypothetical protein
LSYFSNFCITSAESVLMLAFPLSLDRYTEHHILTTIILLLPSPFWCLCSPLPPLSIPSNWIEIVSPLFPSFDPLCRSPLTLPRPLLLPSLPFVDLLYSLQLNWVASSPPIRAEATRARKSLSTGRSLVHLRNLHHLIYVFATWREGIGVEVRLWQWKQNDEKEGSLPAIFGSWCTILFLHSFSFVFML